MKTLSMLTLKFGKLWVFHFKIGLLNQRKQGKSSLCLLAVDREVNVITLFTSDVITIIKLLTVIMN